MRFERLPRPSPSFMVRLRFEWDHSLIEHWQNQKISHNMPPSRSVNALWASWLQEAANHATANGGREADSYKSATTALYRNHPILLVHPSEALAIKFVGKKSR
ncbi:hypothetical protein CROQUDRAFT_97531 [Cronartium quercuum f. sp. fusiforme G11]|uniref:Crossover junction endonuclease MUS81-like HHH domain-containing protein n=1 Tax=Cronartium quercuum f. sp. fusiforme G11 TaxID=708437 RepID=A0A9P6T9E9_9BASI|nr:hypothetical protein CROQUDRAFT_97531 [Cronartium quercuum f. sp. fusiforme G11]